MDKIKVVLVEDNKILSEGIYQGLTDSGYNVKRAYDGEDGFNMIIAEKPSLILLDILLPKMDGISLARKLKVDPAIKDTPIIILTMLDQPEPIAEAINMGIKQYLVKADYKIEDIVKMVKESLTRPTR